MKIENLYRYSDNGGWSWDVVREYYDGEQCKTKVEHYSTNGSGEGLFVESACVGEKQVSGTCQFRLTQKTSSGVRRYIKRWFSAD